ncbi:hypothetical protein Tco_0433084 [Tanacetum coccineum]
MSTTAENVIVAGAENRPPMLERIKNGLFQFGTVKVPPTPNTPALIRERTLVDLTHEEKILTKEIRDRVKLLIEGSKLSLQERESKLYNDFDRFTSEKGDTIYSYYLRFAKLINDMNTIGMTMNTGNVTANQSSVVQCYNFKGSGGILDEEQLAFLVATWERDDLGLETQALTTTYIFQTDDLDAFDSDCDEAPSANAVLMAKLSVYDSNVLYEVPNYDTYQDNNVIDQSVQEMYYFEQPVFVDDSNVDITSDNNVISYDHYMKENESEVVQDTTSFDLQDAMIMFVIEDMSNQVAKCNAVNQENKTVNESLTVELERYKEKVKNFEERQKCELTAREKHIDSQMRAQRIQPVLYSGSALAEKHAAISVIDN